MSQPTQALTQCDLTCVIYVLAWLFSVSPIDYMQPEGKETEALEMLVMTKVKE